LQVVSSQVGSQESLACDSLCSKSTEILNLRISSMILKKFKCHFFMGTIFVVSAILGAMVSNVSDYANSTTSPRQLSDDFNKELLPVSDGFDGDDDRFIQEDFSQALFAQVRQINRECGFHNATSPCSVRIYAFRNASLITQRNGVESAKYTLTFYQPVSQPQALAHVNILNEGREFDSTRSEVRSDEIVYKYCPYDAGGQEPAMLCEAKLYLTPNNQISGITILFSSP
jgi:hypothetical protein